MEHFDLYEIWAERGGKWELVAAFRDFNIASAVAKNYSYRMRLVHVSFEDGKLKQRETLAEVGVTRQKP